MIVLTVITSKPDNDVAFFKDVDVINYMLDEYIFPQKLIAVTKFSDNELVSTTTLSFPTKIEFSEFTTDTVISNYGQRKREYNSKHNIQSESIITHE